MSLLYFEWQWLLRYRLLMPVTLVVLLAGGCSLYYGHAVAIERKQATDSIYADYQHRFDSLLLQQCTADTLTRAGKATVKQLSLAAVVQYQLKPSAILPAAPLSMLSVGVSDMEPYHHRLEISWNYLHGEEKINNPLKLLTGNFDLSFLLIYIFPLLLTGITYNILSREKELGTYSLILVQQRKVLPLLAARLLLRWLLFFILFFLLAVTGLILQGGDCGGLATWALITAAYITFWCMLVFFIVAFNRSSTFNVVVLTSVWILLLVLLPALFRLKGEDNTMAMQTATVAAEQRELEWELWDLPPKQLLDSFYLHYPRYKQDTASVSTLRVAAYYDLVARRMERFVAHDGITRQNELKTLMHSYHFNPPVYAQSLLNQVAHTDALDYNLYEKQVKMFHQQWKEHFLDYFFYDRRFTADDYHRLPMFRYKDDIHRNRRIYSGVGYLLFLSGILGVMGTVILKRKSHP